MAVGNVIEKKHSRANSRYHTCCYAPPKAWWQLYR
uniref:Uncharacterized protein n=1 Tax=Moniliophthora roreri TaxID=221103 RepID=A0A0W0FHJ5_MONRR